MSTAQKDEVSAWRSFMLTPGRYAEPAHIRNCFNSAISAQLAAKLAACARIEDRLSSLLIARHNLSGWLDLEACPQKDRAIALLPQDELNGAARRAGAIYWSGSFATAVFGSEVAGLQRQLGEDLYQFALAHRDLTGPIQDLRPFEALDMKLLADGWRCFEGWRRGQPRAVAERVLLKLPEGYEADTPLGSVFVQKGPEIMHCAASYEVES
jgi:YOP proteins translocation protein K (YscK)